jgi:hypothetical protein
MRIREHSHIIISTIAAALLVVTLTGCAAGPPGAGSTSETTPSPTASTSAAPTIDPTPSATPVPPTDGPAPAAATCDTALSTAEYDQMAADGLTVRTETPNDNLDALMGADGIRCLWRVPSTDIEAWYAQWPSDQATWDSQSAQLVADGAQPVTDGYPGVAQAEYNSALTYRDGTVYYASPARLLGSVLALQ